LDLLVQTPVAILLVAAVTRVRRPLAAVVTVRVAARTRRPSVAHWTELGVVEIAVQQVADALVAYPHAAMLVDAPDGCPTTPVSSRLTQRGCR
jgi:hypothetical protein